MIDFKPNDEQMAAILAIDCNVSVSAGAGSGKTKVLVERFLHILEQDLPDYRATGKLQLDAGNILAITFTRKAAGEMKERPRWPRFRHVFWEAAIPFILRICRIRASVVRWYCV